MLQVFIFFKKKGNYIKLLKYNPHNNKAMELFFSKKQLRNYIYINPLIRSFGLYKLTLNNYKDECIQIKHQNLYYNWNIIKNIEYNKYYTTTINFVPYLLKSNRGNNEEKIQRINRINNLI
jgi:hypothetical protein